VSIALITGCSTGIGFATAVAMARAGYEVFAAMRNPDGSPELAQLAAAEKLPVNVVHLDVDSDESVRSGVQRVLAARGRIDVLVNNAGIGGSGPVEEAEIEAFRKVMETNFFGALRCTQAVLPGMRKQGSGHILNVSSVAGRVALAPQAAYAASKWALEAMSEILAQEVRPFGIRVALIEPGVIATPMFRKGESRQWSSYYPQEKRILALFQSSLQKPTPASVVGDKIVEIVSRADTTLRHPVGPDAKPVLDWRSSMTDEQWIEWGGAASDEEWLHNVKQDLGLEVQFTGTSSPSGIWKNVANLLSMSRTKEFLKTIPMARRLNKFVRSSGY
jgi:NAD(P)-dependent dehydrogenase (short-subunit alcohol dehydrogenase family)